METITRKQFVGAAALSGAAVAAASCATALADAMAEASDEAADAAPANPYDTGADPAPAWLGEEPTYEESQIGETIEADVVVVGAGVSGCAAARAAVEAGASVIIVEKAAEPQGRGEDYTVIGGEVQKRYGRDRIPADPIIDELMKECTFHNKRSILKRWAEECGDAFDWLLEAKPDLFICDVSRQDIPEESKDLYLAPHRYPDPEYYDYTTEQYPIFPVTMQFLPAQAPMVKLNLEKGKSEGDITECYGAFAKKLERDADGRVTGVIFEYADGAVVRANARSGVILATGDYGSNPDMIEAFCPEVIANNIHMFFSNRDVNDNLVNTGDGYKMAAWAGARIQESHAPMIHHMGTPGVMGIAPFLLLNKDGKRFCNEDLPGQQLENQIEQQPGMYAYQLFDAKWPEELCHMPAGHGVACYYDNNEYANAAFDRNYIGDQTLADSVEAGNTIKADTLEELLAQLDIDADAALESIARYNELAAAGEDADFNKKGERVFSLDTAPFYACRFGTAAMLVCIGGVESDPDCHAYDRDFQQIPGLYVTGNMQGGRLAVEYPICCPGISHSMALTFGRIAGTNCAQGK